MRHVTSEDTHERKRNSTLLQGHASQHEACKTSKHDREGRQLSISPIANSTELLTICSSRDISNMSSILFRWGRRRRVALTIIPVCTDATKPTTTIDTLTPTGSETMQGRRPKPATRGTGFVKRRGYVFFRCFFDVRVAVQVKPSKHSTSSHMVMKVELSQT